LPLERSRASPCPITPPEHQVNQSALATTQNTEAIDRQTKLGSTSYPANSINKTPAARHAPSSGECCPTTQYRPPDLYSNTQNAPSKMPCWFQGGCWQPRRKSSPTKSSAPLSAVREFCRSVTSLPKPYPLLGSVAYRSEILR